MHNNFSASAARKRFTAQDVNRIAAMVHNLDIDMPIKKASM
jgi:hypothetical protein